MSSEMREIKAMADAVEYGIALGKLDAPAVFTKMRDLLNLALLARTEAGADGAEPFGWWIECHGTDGDFGQFVTDRAFVDLLRSHGVVERETALYTHPQDASGDAVTGRVNGYMFSARAIEIITHGEVPEWITKAPGLRVTITAMQAKEAE